MIHLTKQQKAFYKMQKNRKGSFLVGGPLASGKSTALHYCLLKEMTKFQWFGWFRKKSKTLLYCKNTAIATQSFLKHADMFGIKVSVIGYTVFYKDKPRIYIIDIPMCSRSLERDICVIDNINSTVEMQFRGMKAKKNLLSAYPEDKWFKSIPRTDLNLTENPYLSPEYLNALDDLPNKEIKKYIEGNWDYKEVV